jgi:hypothetical protein
VVMAVEERERKRERKQKSERHVCFRSLAREISARQKSARRVLLHVTTYETGFREQSTAFSTHDHVRVLVGERTIRHI